MPVRNRMMEVHFKDLEGFVQRMDQRGEDIQDAAREATEKAVIHVHEKVPNYPTASGRAMQFKSLKQWWFVLMSIQEGSITVPYRRTGQMGRSITTEVKKLGSNWVGIIGTATVYAPWVISTKNVGSRGPQASYFQGVWYTLQGVVESCREAILRIYRNEVVNKLNKP